MIPIEERFPIRVVARRTGLSVHVIRVWERRYNAVVPMRGATKRRMYSAGDIERFRLLRRATQLGHSISLIANKSQEELLTIIAEDTPPALRTSRLPATAERHPAVSVETLVEQCLAATEQCDDRGLAHTLYQACDCLDEPYVVDSVVIPFVERVHNAWRSGTLGLANVQIASLVTQSFLTHLQLGCAVTSDAPLLVVAAPLAPPHDLGASIAALAGAQAGWRVLCLGANLPVEEIARIAGRFRARAVALSTCYAEPNSALPREIELLRNSLAPSTVLFVGGHAGFACRDGVTASGVVFQNEAGAFRAELERIPRSRA